MGVEGDVESNSFGFFFLMIRRPPRSTQSRSSAASDVYKRQHYCCIMPQSFQTSIFAFSLSIMIISCASFIPEKESWEGIKDNILRVYIHHEHMDDLNGSDNSREKELLEVTGRNRAEMLLLSYIRMHVAGIDRIICLLYTSDAADDLLCVDLGGRRIIEKKKKHYTIR